MLSPSNSRTTRSPGASAAASPTRYRRRPFRSVTGDGFAYGQPVELARVLGEDPRLPFGRQRDERRVVEVPVRIVGGEEERVLAVDRLERAPEMPHVRRLLERLRRQTIAGSQATPHSISTNFVFGQRSNTPCAITLPRWPMPVSHSSACTSQKNVPGPHPVGFALMPPWPPRWIATGRPTSAAASQIGW